MLMYFKRSNPNCNGNDYLAPLTTPLRVISQASLVPMNNGRNQKTIKRFCIKVSMDIWKSPSTQYRRDIVALRTTCIKNVKFKIFKIRTGCQYVGYL